MIKTALYPDFVPAHGAIAYPTLWVQTHDQLFVDCFLFLAYQAVQPTYPEQIETSLQRRQLHAQDFHQRVFLLQNKQRKTSK